MTLSPIVVISYVMNSIISLIYESGTYDLKLLKIVQMYGEKVVACYNPPPQEILSGGYQDDDAY